MPTESSFNKIDIPDDDLWDLMFERPRTFAQSKVMYRSSSDNRAYTFDDVKAKAIAFGQGLQDSWEWQKGEVFGVYAPNDVDFGPLVFGVLYAGGVVSPANPGYSADELSYQLANSHASAIATTKDHLPIALEAARKCQIEDQRIILIGATGDENSRFKHWSSIRKTSRGTSNKRPAIESDKDLAFLVYSSGTTGLPKGVMLSHRNLVADVLMIERAVGHWYAGDRDKILGVLPFFHIYGLTGLVLQSLHRGIELVVMPGFELMAFLSTVQKHKITLIYVAPPVIVRLARDPVVDKFDMSSVKMLTCGAAPLTKELVDAVHRRLQIKVNQAYGLSETSPMTHTQPWDEWYKTVGSVGKMFPNMTAKYIAPDGSEVGAGKPGELWLKGPNVFKGYWKNEEATKEALTEDGFFKTGDVGYQDRDNNFYITDRVKELIKYKGFQVAPAELEGKLMDHPGINDVAVIGVYDNHNHTEVPRAYVVAANGKDGEVHAAEISDWLSTKVASHKRLRGGVHFISEIPKSASGKILRRVLKEKAKEDMVKEPRKAKL